VFYATGARTGELAKAKVRDFLPRSRQIVLGNHKRSATEKVPTVRHITLNETAFEILSRLCEGRDREDHIFLTRDKRRWDAKKLNKRLRTTRRVAVALGNGVREDVTIYDFRHLWISEALMAGVDMMTVAKMAGTSVRMIETVYGHFRRDHYVAAQKLLDEKRQAHRDRVSQASRR
jgi:integrase